MSPIDDNLITVEFTPEFDRWLLDLRDVRAAAKIADRLEKLALGYWGDVKPVGEGISEMRLAYGPGYRLYALKRAAAWVIMLAGGDKSSQRRDIEAAKRRARELRDAD